MDKEEPNKKYLPPDYSEAVESEGPKEDDDSDDDDDDDIDEEIEEDEDKVEKELNERDNKKVVTDSSSSSYTPFGSASGNWGGNRTQQSNSSPTFGSGSWRTGSGYINSPIVQQSGSGNYFYGDNNYGNNAFERRELLRNKKVIFCDFLDCIVETLSSNGNPGNLPRGLWDLRPREEVWNRIAGIDPEKIYILVQPNLIPIVNGCPITPTLEHFCLSLSLYVRKTYNCAKAVIQNVIGQPKEEVMLSIIDDREKPIPREDIVSIGIYSGLGGRSNRDLIAAQRCNIDYVDIIQLLNYMY